MEEYRKMKPLQKKDFGMTSKGAQATLYILENEAGMQISVSDFGATLTSVLVPDKDNNPVEVLPDIPDLHPGCPSQMLHGYHLRLQPSTIFRDKNQVRCVSYSLRHSLSNDILFH